MVEMGGGESPDSAISCYIGRCRQDEQTHWENKHTLIEIIVLYEIRR